MIVSWLHSKVWGIKEQYDGSMHIPGHSCIPQCLYWLRRAANDNGDETARMKAKGLEEACRIFVTDVWKLPLVYPERLESDNVQGSCKGVPDAKQLGTVTTDAKNSTGSVVIKSIVLIQRRNSLKSSTTLISWMKQFGPRSLLSNIKRHANNSLRLCLKHSKK